MNLEKVESHQNQRSSVEGANTNCTNFRLSPALLWWVVRIRHGARRRYEMENVTHDWFWEVDPPPVRPGLLAEGFDDPC